jgi:hypothetical protein
LLAAVAVEVVLLAVVELADLELEPVCLWQLALITQQQLGLVELLEQM